jgi:phage major head subunit gpT-like protein
MAIINRTTITTLIKGLSLKFTDAFKPQANPNMLTFEDVGMVLPSTSSIEEHAWLQGTFGAMREWLGERNVNNLKAEALAVSNKKFEKTYGIKREEIEDDKLGTHSVLVASLATVAAMLPYDLAVASLAATDTWADGANFFGTSRTYGGNTISNLRSGGSTGVLTQANFEAACVLMEGYKDHEGRVMKVMPTVLVVAPDLRTTAFNILKNDKVVSSSAAIDNPNKDRVAYKVCPELAAGTWYLLGTVGGIKPICYQERVKPEFQTNYNENADWNSDHLFLKDEILYGTRARGAAFKVAPHLIIKGDGT